MRKSLGSILGWIIIAYLSVMLLFCIIWFFPSNDKGHYKDYKKYESKIDATFKKNIEEVEKYKKLYYENQLNKRQIIARLEQGADSMEKLYDSFKWTKGDELTKELFVLKKQIIINYAQVYRNKAQALDKELYFNEVDEMSYINTIIDRYNVKDKLEKERFNIDF
ncbi:hypothetical protein NBE98_01085 [Clostridium swellfunianum]|uniref:hypothetical protein n=1 Tax=Clostridium swellfunianum TaxID=1367462 RepID=UPI00202E5794|nr:hypothetical protein [Clostridium swellfunianum]MCM0646966.1 hypothetical protein [Clostridium swellfunianum]